MASSLAIRGEGFVLEQARGVGYRFVRACRDGMAGWRRAEKYHIGMPADLSRKLWNRPRPRKRAIPGFRKTETLGRLHSGWLQANKRALTDMLRIDRARRALAAVAATMIVVAAPAAAQTQPQGLSGMKLQGDQPIQIESDKLEVRDAEHLAIFSGNVSVVQGKTLLKAGKLTVHYAQASGSATTGSSQIERLEVDNEVYVKSEDQVATGDRGTFDMKTETLTLTGEKVVLTQGPNVLVGCKLTVDMKTNQANFEGCNGGRVKTLFQPNTAKPANQGN
jgi:lipopolysaccharide export system protein LptA